MSYDVKAFIMDINTLERATVLIRAIETMDDINYYHHTAQLEEILLTGDSYDSKNNAMAINAVLEEHIMSLLRHYGIRLNEDQSYDLVFLERLITAVVTLENIDDRMIVEDALESGHDAVSKTFNCLMTVSDLTQYELEESVVEVSSLFLEKIEGKELTPAEFFERDDTLQISRLKNWGKLKAGMVIVDFLNTVGRLGYQWEPAFNILKEQLLTITDETILADNIVAFVLGSDVIHGLSSTAYDVMEQLVPDIRQQGTVGRLITASLMESL